MHYRGQYHIDTLNLAETAIAVCPSNLAVQPRNIDCVLGHEESMDRVPGRQPQAVGSTVTGNDDIGALPHHARTSNGSPL